MKSQDVKKSNYEAMKNMMDLEGNLSTFHFVVIYLFGLYGHSSKYACNRRPAADAGRLKKEYINLKREYFPPIL